VKQIQFLVVSFHAAILMLNLNCKQRLRRVFKPKTNEATNFSPYFTEQQKEKITTFLTPRSQNIQPVTLGIVLRI
jgi:hypothetical protein